MGNLNKDSSVKNGLRDIRVYEESETAHDLNPIIAGKAGGIPLSLSACEKSVEMKVKKAAPKRKVETKANDTTLFLDENSLPEEFRYEDDQCSEVTCEAEDFPASPSVDGETLELSSHENKDYLAIGCQTPKESIFDPFAPGAEELAFAPKKKVPYETKLPLWRKLNYDLFDDSFALKEGNICEDLAEDCLVDFISKSLLELIVVSEAQKFQDDINPVDDKSLECPKTPTGIRLLTGIAETCPPAPIRPAGRSRMLSKEICRKLDFEVDLV